MPYVSNCYRSVVLVVGLVLIGGLAKYVECRAQVATDGSIAVKALSASEVTMVRSEDHSSHVRVHSLHGSLRLPSSVSPQKGKNPRFGTVLGGSAVGATVGTGMGVLLLKGSAELYRGTDRNRQRSTLESEVATAMGLIGVACILAGAPIGAVELGGIDQRRRAAYEGAGVGELVGGIVGYALARGLQGATTLRFVGVGAGVVFGTAGGALLRFRQKKQEGAFSWRMGDWHVSLPSVRVQLPVASDRSAAVSVTVMSFQF